MTIDEKLQHFYDITVDDAREEAARAINAHKDTLEKMLQAHKKSGRENAEAALKAEAENARREVNKALSTEQIMLRQNLSKKQEELKNQLFTEIHRKLIQFKTTPEYEEYLAEKIHDARSFAGEDELHIYLAAEDGDLLENMIHKTRCPLEVSDVSFLGGIKATIPSKNILIDNSFLENFNAVRREFKFDGGHIYE